MNTHQPVPKYREWAAKSGTPWEVFFPQRGPVKGQRRFFKTEAEANAEVASWLKGDRSVTITKRLQDEVQYVSEQLPEGVTLTDLLRFYMHHHSGIVDATLGSICTDYLGGLKKRKASEDYQVEQARLVKTITTELGADTLFSALTKARLVKFINEPDTYWNRYGRRRLVSCLVSKAREMEAIKADPLEGWKFEKAPKVPPHILKQADVETVLEYYLEHMPHLVPSLALQLFAGIRTEELCRSVTSTKRPLAWEDITFGTRIEVPVDVSKTNDRRTIDFWPPALTHWLNAVKVERKGPVCPVALLDQAKWKYIAQMNHERVAEGLPSVAFKQNDFRRTYASHAYALHGGRVTDWTGHSAKILKKHYQHYVDQASATAYFNSKPRDTADNVISISA